MRVRMTFSRAEFVCFEVLVRDCYGLLTGEGLEEVLGRESLRRLFLRVAGRMPALKKKNAVTLTDVEVVTLWWTLGVGCAGSGALEEAVGREVLAAIDRERMAAVAAEEANMVIKS